ncbi:unnamed protein product [Brachionus calyciflorus]|uniref:C2 domain-containing protein n=1 Tax=Brachionus calyciflorus TaxID=104777 RepID=A0A813SF52_9BILA|nr:unnamed protein product [Brachionus calyciflorus]
MAQPRTNLITHVSNKGFEVIEVMVHTAANIPINGQIIPNCYVTSQSKYTLESRDAVEKPNATVSIEGQFPVWNDLLFVETLEENVLNEELILLVIDEPQNKNIAEFRIPWDWLHPFYQYHLELNINIGRKAAEPLKLYVSLTRKQSYLAKKEFKYYGLEMLLNHFDNQMSQKLSIYAVARIVPNYLGYKNTFLKSSEASIIFTPIYFPSPSKTSFRRPPFSIEGYPQATLATRSSSIPVWNHNFNFISNEEKDSMFNESSDSGLVVEFYSFNKYNKTWSIKNLLGWCKIKLDKRCSKQLEDDETKSGLRTENMLVETDGSLAGQSSKNLTAEVVVRIVPDRSPRKILNSVNSTNLPVLNSYYYEDEIKKNIEPVYLQTKYLTRPPPVIPRSPEIPIQNTPRPRVVHTPINNNNNSNNSNTNPVILSSRSVPSLPIIPNDPNIYNIYNTSQIQQKETGDFLNYLKPNITDFRNVQIRDPSKVMLFQRDDFLEVPLDYRSTFLNYREPLNNDIEGWLIYYTNILNAYKSLVKKMNEDLVLYRQQIRNLELSNVQLTTRMNNFEDKKTVLIKLAEINETDKTKLNQSFLELKSRIALKTNENIVLKDQIERLQREIEKRKEGELEMRKLLLVQSSLKNELELMRQRLAKAYGLEDTVKRQEIVIEKLEQYIRRLNGSKRAESRNADIFKLKNDDYIFDL